MDIKLRKDARRLIQMARDDTQPQRKEELATRALELAQRAELITDLKRDPDLLAIRIARYRSRLAREAAANDQKRVLEAALADAEALMPERHLTLAQPSGSRRAAS